MDDTKNVYKSLTNVDIDVQRRIWDERGRGYYGEYLLFSKLYQFLPGNGKILMNLNIPISADKTTEIDLLLIHETGLYVFEIKHYKGTIYGQDTERTWTQYFRTAPNESFRNPVLQNGYHLRALNNIFPSMPLNSFVVFTNDDCELRISNSNPDLCICRINELEGRLLNRIRQSEYKYSIDKINDIFNQLSVYSPMQKKVEFSDAEPVSFEAWLKPIIENLEKEKAKLQLAKKDYDRKSEEIAKRQRNMLLAAAVFAMGIIAICSAVSIFTINKNLIIQKQSLAEKEKELSAFKQNFLHVDEINNEYITSLASYFSASEQKLEPLTNDAVTFAAIIYAETDVYGMALTESTRYIVMTREGKIFEYNMFGESLRYSRIGNIIGKGIRSYGKLSEIQFYGITNPNEIEYIKITDIQLLKLDMFRTIIKDKLELELYSAE